MVSVMILTSVYYLNIPDEDDTIEGNEYLKSEICYYTLQGIKSDYHYHFQLNITINGERIEIPTNIGFEKDDNEKLYSCILFIHMTIVVEYM